MIRGLSPGITLFLFVVFWAAMYVILRYLAPTWTRTQIRQALVSFVFAIAAFITVGVVFTLLSYT